MEQGAEGTDLAPLMDLMTSYIPAPEFDPEHPMQAYVTNLDAPTPEYVLGAYHQLWQVEKSFRMSKSDLRARPIFHHKRESIEAHLTIVMAALAVARLVEQSTDWSIARFVKTLRPCRTITIQAGDQTVTAADPIPDEALQALTRLRADSAH